MSPADEVPPAANVGGGAKAGASNAMRIAPIVTARSGRFGRWGVTANMAAVKTTATVATMACVAIVSITTACLAWTARYTPPTRAHTTPSSVTPIQVENPWWCRRASIS